MASGVASVALATGHKQVDEGEAILRQCWEDLRDDTRLRRYRLKDGLEIRSLPHRESAPSLPPPATADQIIESVKLAIAANRWITAGMGLVTIRKLYPELDWPAFDAEHFPGVDTAKLIARVTRSGPATEPTPARNDKCNDKSVPLKRGRPKTEKALTVQERVRQFRSRKKAAVVAPEPKPPAPHRDPLDLNPSDAANAVATAMHEFLIEYEAKLEPWLRDRAQADDRLLIRAAINRSVNELGQWALELWDD